MRHMIFAGETGAGEARQAFTLIELLIVVAIIAILAAIAVPNFLEAQTRAKISRVHADMRALATGIESYHVDHRHYPWINVSTLPPKYNEIGYRLTQLSTPIAYLTQIEMRDPFLSGDSDRDYGDGLPRTQYNYRNHEFWKSGSTPWMKTPVWVLNSIGPDQTANKGLMTEMWARGLVAADYVTVYDASNGTTSAGDIPRTGGMTQFHPIR